MKERLQAAARRADVHLDRGVYAMVTGPNFETPAEVRMLGIVGADMVGMSTVPETLVARHAGMKVAAVSVVSNLAAGLAGHELTHEETMEEGAKAAGKFIKLLRAFITDIGAE